MPFLLREDAELLVQLLPVGCAGPAPASPHGVWIGFMQLGELLGGQVQPRPESGWQVEKLQLAGLPFLEGRGSAGGGAERAWARRT